MKNLARNYTIEAKESPKRSERPLRELARNCRILVVEDEREIARSYMDILCPQQTSNVVSLKSSRSQKPQASGPLASQAEFEVVIAHDPETAIALVKTAMQKGQPFAMGFFDVLLGADKDGFELVKSIREIDPRLLAVFVTAYNDRSVDSIQAVLGDNNNSSWDYLNKPFSSGEILQKARNFTAYWNLQAEKMAKEEMLSSLQQKLMESERHSAVAAVSRGVNHEFGNVLMQIMGKADLAKGRSPELMNDALTKILEATTRASEILDRFRHLASGSSYKAEKEVVDLPGLVDEALSLLEHQLNVNNVKICKIKIEKVSAPVHATSIMQVLVNLMINSMHAMGSSGQIDISIKKLESNEVEIYLRDYGPGIPENLIERAKEPFFTTKGEMGTGLGLAISTEIVEMEHQGQFTLKNHGMKGLEARIVLPLTTLASEDVGGDTPTKGENNE